MRFVAMTCTLFHESEAYSALVSDATGVKTLAVLKWRLVDAKVLTYAAHADGTLNLTLDIDDHRVELDSPQRHDMLIQGIINQYVSPRGLRRCIYIVDAIWCAQVPGGGPRSGQESTSPCTGTTVSSKKCPVVSPACTGSFVLCTAVSTLS